MLVPGHRLPFGMECRHHYNRLLLWSVPRFIYENTGSNHKLGSWYPLVLIAIFNVSDLISRYIPLADQLNITNKRVLLSAALSRFALVPTFYFAGKDAGEGWMMLVTSFMGLSNGYLTVCAFTLVPGSYRSKREGPTSLVDESFVLNEMILISTVECLQPQLPPV
ncbi:hypothetical protein ACFE04_000720 [Oxalis oulophora]